jgi:membrane-associated protease RseP (regulator of RpoE activity)
MVSFDTIATITLVIILTIAVVLNRKKLTFHRFWIFYAAMYRTKFGLRAMDAIANKFGPLIRASTPWIIALGFIGMAVVVFDLARNLVKILSGAITPSVGVVLPIEAKGVFYVPFLFWIISILVILILHEGAHGVWARAFKLPIKNSGLVVVGALVPIIPGAFVEPDEKRLVRAKAKEQLGVYAAGPAINIITGFMFLAVFSFLLVPLTDKFYSNNGVTVTELMDGNPPAQIAGMQAGETITQIDGEKIANAEEFSAALTAKQPGDTVNIITSNAVYDITLGENPETKKAWLGVFVEQPLANTSVWASMLIWVKDLFWWLFLLSLGVGLFNLVPIGPIDGGRMLLCALQKVTHDVRANRIWKSVSLLILGILLTNVAVAFI